VTTERPALGASRALVVFLTACAAAGLLAIFLDRHEIARLLGHTDWRLVPFALAATGVSYLSLSAGLVTVGELLDIRAPRLHLLRAAYISEVLNHVVSLGGVAGYSLRTAVVVRMGVRAGDILAMSLLHSYMNNSALALLLGAGLFVLTTSPVIAPPWTVAATALGILVATFTTISTAALFSTRVRAPLVWVSRRIVALLPRHWRETANLAVTDLDIALDRGSTSVRKHPARAIPPALFIAVDWVAALAAFWLCLAAFGTHVTIPVLVSGVTIGVAAGFIAVIPGGLGVQEGTLVGVFALFGVPVSHAALASILFRIVYYFVPYLVSLTMYVGAARGTPDAAREPDRMT
jgi:hypothetical protein